MSGTPWRERANCAGSPEPWIFDATIDDDNTERRDARAERHALALSICRTCSVQAECLADTAGQRTEGVRGGKVFPPLKFQHTKHPERVTIAHGTEAGYAAHKRLGQPVNRWDSCGCRGAARRARQDREQKAAS